MDLRSWLLLLVVSACERAPASNETPPPPTPIVPVPHPPITPQPVYPITPGKEKLYDTITFRISPTELSANGIRIMPLAATTEPAEIERAAFAALSPSQLDRNTNITIMADKEVAYVNLIAVMKGAERAGYTKFGIAAIQ